MRQKDNFMDDEEKINDLFLLSRIEFLIRYKDVSEEEYKNTISRIKLLIENRIKQNKRQRTHREANIEEERRKQREYHQQNKDRINARRNYLYSLKTKEKKTPKEKQILIEYMLLHKEEIDEMKMQRDYEKRLLGSRLYYWKKKEAKLNGK